MGHVQMAATSATCDSQSSSFNGRQILRSREQRPSSEPRDSGVAHKRRRKSFPRSFEADVNSGNSRTGNGWQILRRRLIFFIMIVAVITLVISILVSSFRFTRITTFYHVVKKKLMANAARVFKLIES